MAASILSFGMLTARAFWMVRRNIGLEAGSVPPAFTAMVMSLAMRANCFAMRFHRANIVCLRTSKMRPMVRAWCTNAAGRASAGGSATRQRLAPYGAGRHKALCELRLQHAHAPALQAQPPLDLREPALQIDLLPLLEHGALLVLEPLLLDACPLGERGQEVLVLVSDARAQRLQMRRRAGRQCRQPRLGALELHGEERALDLEHRRALQARGEPEVRKCGDQPLGGIPLPPAHTVAVVVREDVVEVVIALAVGNDRDQWVVARGVV